MTGAHQGQDYGLHMSKGEVVLCLDPTCIGGQVETGALWAFLTDGAGCEHQADVPSDKGTRPAPALMSPGVGHLHSASDPTAAGCPHPVALATVMCLSLYIKLFFPGRSLRAEAEQDTSGSRCQLRVWATAGVLQQPLN